VVPFFDMRGHLAAIRDELDAAVQRVVGNGQLVLGPETEAFEREFAAYCGAKHCVGVGNGLDALTLALRGAGIGAGDEVIVPAQTFIASWLAASMAGACPVPVDVDEASFNIDPNKVEAAITPRTAAIMPVHLYGQACDMKRLREIAARHDLFLLEDAAQAHGSAANNVRSGALGDAAGFSFYPTKNLGALGDSGAVVTNDGALADRVRKLRNYGSTTKYVHDVVAGNSRLDELQSALLRVKMRHLDNWNERRRAIAARYDERLRGLNRLTTPKCAPGYQHVYHLYVIRSVNRNRLQRALERNGVTTQIHYPIPPHRQQAYAELAIPPGAFPVTDRVAAQCLSLPIWPQMTDAQVDAVCDAIDAFERSTLGDTESG
jgi:dTDP-4-amino-4,6-dideoxygalactose transaminase